MSGRTRPDIIRAFQHLETLIVPEGPSLDDAVRAARAGLDRYGDVDPRRPSAGLTVQPVDLGGMAAEWLSVPRARDDRRILWLHGGSVMAGSLHSHRPLCAMLARLTGLPVLNIAYRLAPEHTYPAAHDDCARALAWMVDNGPAGPSLAGGVMLVGDSVGGNLAAAVCARSIGQGGRVPDKLVLLGPCLDSTDNADRPDRDSDPFVNAEVLAAIQIYCGGVARDHPEISALFMPDAVLAQFPPTLIQVSAAEYLLRDSQVMAQRLAALDRRVVLSVWPDMPHVWHAFVDLLPEARAAFAEVAAFLDSRSV